MKTRLWLFVFAWLIAVPAAAQFLGPPQNITVVDSGTACVTAPHACAIFDVNTAVSVAFDISGTWTGTLTFEATSNGSVWRTLYMMNAATGAQQGTTTLGGTFTAANGGFTQVRARATATITGSALVSGTRGYGVSAHLLATGDGTPGGAVNSVQYQVDASTFGGSPALSAVGGALLSTGTGTWFANVPTDQTSGSFDWVVGVAANTPDPRPDHTMTIGWNVGGEVVQVGSNGLSFESYCSLGTGCLTGAGGQSETYFQMEDGHGNGVRPFGMFQRKNDNGDPYLYMISRGDAWSYWDDGFQTPIWEMSPASIVSHLPITFPQTGDALVQEGSALIGTYSDIVTVSADGGVTLGSTGEFTTKVATNHFQLTNGPIEDASGLVRLGLGAGNAAQHLSIANTVDGVNLTVAGTSATTTNLGVFLPGSTSFIIDYGTAGIFRSYAHAVLGFTTGGVASTTSNSCGTTAPSIAGGDNAGKVTVGATSGTSCTITFGYAYVFAPACVANNETTDAAVFTKSTTGTVVLRGSFTAGDVISYLCIGGQ